MHRHKKAIQVSFLAKGANNYFNAFSENIETRKPHKYKICEKRFAVASYLKHHMTTHLGVHQIRSQWNKVV